MIERPYLAICDECYTEAEPISARLTDYCEYCSDMRLRGWTVKRSSALCPDCSAEKADG